MSYAAIHPNWEKEAENMVDGYSLEGAVRANAPASGLRLIS